MFTICSLWTPEIACYAKAVEQNHHDYAMKHGYKHAVCHHNPTDRPPSWGKIKFLLANMYSNDWLLWVDADAVFTNFNMKSVPVEGKSILISEDFNGINAGVFMLRSSEWSRQWLNTIYDKTQFINHPWWEQAAIMDDFNKPETRKQAAFLPWLQSYPSNWKPGDFIFHTPGMGLEEKTKLLLEKL